MGASRTGPGMALVAAAALAIATAPAARAADRAALYTFGATPVDPAVWRLEGEEALDPKAQTRFVKRLVLRATEAPGTRVDRVEVEVGFPARSGGDHGGTFSVPLPADAFIEIALGARVAFRLSAFPPIPSGFHAIDAGGRYRVLEPAPAPGDATAPAGRRYRIVLARRAGALEASIDGRLFATAPGPHADDEPLAPIAISSGFAAIALGALEVEGRSAGGTPLLIVDGRPGVPASGAPDDVGATAAPPVETGVPRGLVLLGALATALAAGLGLGHVARGGAARLAAGALAALSPLLLLRAPVLVDPRANGALAAALAAVASGLVVVAALKRRRAAAPGAPPVHTRRRGLVPLLLLAAFLAALEVALDALPGRAFRPEARPFPTLAAGSDPFRGGFRGAPRPAVPKPAGVVRVIAIGGSSANGFPYAHAGPVWPAQLERRLAARAAAAGDPRRFEVLNAAQLGFTSTLARLVLERHLLALEPDVVVLACWFNDSTRRPRFFGSLPALSDRQVFERSGWMGVAPWRRVFRELDRTRLLWLLRAVLSGGADLVPGPARGPLDPRALPPRGSPDEVARNIRDLAALGRAHGFRLVLVPEIWQYGPPIEEARAMNPWVAAIERAARDEGATLADALTPAAARRLDPIFFDFIHPTEAGHAVYAEAVERALVESGLAPRDHRLP